MKIKLNRASLTRAEQFFGGDTSGSISIRQEIGSDLISLTKPPYTVSLSTPELCAVVTLADIEGLCKVAAAAPDQDEFLLNAELAPLVGNSKENMPTSQDLPDPREEIDMFDVMAAKVRAGEPLHVLGQLEGGIGKLHIAMINRLKAATGMPVHVIHS